jgi:hypothetical protein
MGEGLKNSSTARNRQDRHDLDALARKDRKMRVIVEQFRCGLVRARTTVKAPISFEMSAMPLASTFFVLPRGPPMATIAAWCCSTHAFHAAMPCCSLIRRSASGSAFQAVHFALVLLPRKTARNVSLVLMGFSLCG